jgi:tellurite methyltransferase
LRRQLVSWEPLQGGRASDPQLDASRFHCQNLCWPHCPLAADPAWAGEQERKVQKSIDFFETQFQRQVADLDHPLNPFERRALPYLRGQVLDFGCGLGNLALAAAERGCEVLALDAAPTAIRHLQSLAVQRGLNIQALQADLRSYRIDARYDAVVAIGLLMFFERQAAQAQLAQLLAAVRPGGVAVVNVLIEGTTFMDMFDPAGYYLFAPDELKAALGSWEVLEDSTEDFAAPGDTIKRFSTMIARRPAG